MNVRVRDRLAKVGNSGTSEESQYTGVSGRVVAAPAWVRGGNKGTAV
jgi:hypothetical protein